MDECDAEDESARAQGLGGATRGRARGGAQRRRSEGRNRAGLTQV